MRPALPKTDIVLSAGGIRMPNPVTNQGLRYVYQGFTNDGQYLVSFWWPVRTSALPDDPSGVSAEDQEIFSSEFNQETFDAYMSAQAEALTASQHRIGNLTWLPWTQWSLLYRSRHAGWRHPGQDLVLDSRPGSAR